MIVWILPKWLQKLLKGKVAKITPTAHFRNLMSNVLLINLAKEED